MCCCCRARYSRSSKNISMPWKLLAAAWSSLVGRECTQARPRDMEAMAGLYDILGFARGLAVNAAMIEKAKGEGGG